MACLDQTREINQNNFLHSEALVKLVSTEQRFYSTKKQTKLGFQKTVSVFLHIQIMLLSHSEWTEWSQELRN